MADTINRVQAVTGSLANTAVQRRKRRKNKKNRLSTAQSTPSQAQVRLKLINMTSSNKVSFPTSVPWDSFVDQSFHDDLWSICGFDIVQPPRTNPLTKSGHARARKQAAEHYTKCLNRLVAEREAYLQFLMELVRATTLIHDGDETRTVARWSLSALQGHHERLVEAVSADRKLLLKIPTNRLDIEELSGDLPLVWERLRKLLLSAVQQFESGLKNTLNRLAELSVLGAINWFDDNPPSCRAAFFTQTGRFKVATASRDFLRAELVECAALHSVSLINTWKTAASPVTGLFEARHPTRITRLLEKVPESLKGRLSVVHGTRIRSLTVEQEIRPTEKIVIAPPAPRYRVHTDPLLVWNDIVLCGWEPEEASRERNDKVFGNFPYLVR